MRSKLLWTTLALLLAVASGCKQRCFMTEADWERTVTTRLDGDELRPDLSAQPLITPSPPPQTLRDLERKTRFLSPRRVRGHGPGAGPRRPAQPAVPRHGPGQPRAVHRARRFGFRRHPGAGHGPGAGGSQHRGVPQQVRCRRLQQHPVHQHRPAHRHAPADLPGRRPDRHPAAAGHRKRGRHQAVGHRWCGRHHLQCALHLHQPARPHQPVLPAAAGVPVRPAPVAGLRRRDQPAPRDAPHHRQPRHAQLLVPAGLAVPARRRRHPHHPPPLRPAAGRVRAERQPDAAQRRGRLLEPLRLLLEPLQPRAGACASPTRPSASTRPATTPAAPRPATSSRPAPSTSSSAPSACRPSTPCWRTSASCAP